jgi:hypothetical protein
MNTMLLPLLLLAATLHPGPERPVVPPVRDASPYSQVVTSVAAGDDGVALVVWEEERERFAAARIDRDGRRLDAAPIVLAAGGDAARGAGNWLVAGFADGKVTAQLVDDDGTAGEPITLAEVAHTPQVRVAFDGTQYLVVWNLVHGFHAARLDTRGRIVEQDITFDAPGEYRELDVVGLDGGFAVVTLHLDHMKLEFTVEAYRLDGNADLVSYGWLDRTSSATVSDLRVTADGDTLVATWRAVRIGAEEVFLARERQPLRIIASNSIPLDITRIGNSVYVFLTENSEFGDNVIVSETGGREWTWPALAFGMAAGSFGDRALLVAESLRPEQNLYTTVFDATLQQVAPIELLGLEPALQERPSIARAANGRSLVVWVESGRGDGAAIAAARIDGAGRPLDSQPIIIAAGLPRRSLITGPQVASNGEEWLVVWNADGEVRSRRVLRDGSLPGPAVALAAAHGAEDEVCVAWNGREYLAGYVAEAITVPAAAFMIPISAGNVPGTPVQLSGAGPGGRILCAAAGGDTLFAWLSGTTIVRADGTTSGPLPLTELMAVASNGERFAVAWLEGTGWDEPLRIGRAIVTREGTVSVVPEPAFTGQDPALAATRDGFVLVWGREDLYALELDAEGRAIGEPFALSATGLREHWVALAGGDVPLAVYMRELPSSLELRYRIFARALTDGGGPRRRAIRH